MYWVGDSLPLLSPKAFRYYLPRFIAFCLEHSDSSADAVINYNLAPSGSLDDGERDRFVYFSPAERRVVAEFVEHRSQMEGAEFDRVYLDQARAYWNSEG
jgi:hypothetical protein